MSGLAIVERLVKFLCKPPGDVAGSGTSSGCRTRKDADEGAMTRIRERVPLSGQQSVGHRNGFLDQCEKRWQAAWPKKLAQEG